MRLHFQDYPEELNKLKGMRAKITRYCNYLAEGSSGEPCNETVTILGLCGHGSKHVQLQWPNGKRCHWWVDVELDPDENY